jgi:tetratricopeptide (TPR) repeat protein
MDSSARSTFDASTRKFLIAFLVFVVLASAAFYMIATFPSVQPVMATVNWNFLGMLLGISLALVGVYPVSYLAYQEVISRTQEKRLKEDFYLLGLDTAEEFSLTAEELYRTAYSATQFLAFIILIVFLSLLILVSYYFRETITFIEPQTISLIFYAYLGAYVFSIQELIRRYNTYDLQPQVYSSILVRMLVATTITFAGASMLMASGETLSSAEAGAGAAEPTGWAALLAFLIGIFPSRGLRWFQSRANQAVDTGGEQGNSLSVREIQGISTWHESRLLEMGVDDVQNLATIDIRKVLLSTRFDTQEIVNWIDQAILLDKVRSRYQRFKDANINTFHEFRTRLQQIREGADAKEAEEVRQTLATVLALSGPEELDYLARYSNYPNYAFLAEYYLNIGQLARQRATAAVESLRGAKEDSDFERAAEEYCERLRLHPEEARTWKRYGVALFKLKRWQEAFEALSKAIELDSTSAVAFSNRASLLLQLPANDAALFQQWGGYEAVIRDCTRSIALDPTDELPYNYRGQVYTLTGEYARAIQDFDRALANNDQYADAYLNRGIAYNAVGNFTQALSDLEDAYLLGLRDTFELWQAWGTALIGAGNFGLAIERLSRAVTFEHPSLHAAYTKLGIAYFKLDPKLYAERARQNFEAALKCKPDLLDVYNYLGLLETTLDRPVNAIAYYQQALGLDPSAYITRYNLALAYARARDLESAHQHFALVVQNAPAASSEALEAQRWVDELERRLAAPPPGGDGRAAEPVPEPAHNMVFAEAEAFVEVPENQEEAEPGPGAQPPARERRGKKRADSDE